MQETVVTYVYLPTEVRQKLDHYAQTLGVPISETARRFIVEGLERETESELLWIRTALTVLLKYHPRGDLEIAVTEALRINRQSHHG